MPDQLLLPLEPHEALFLVTVLEDAADVWEAGAELLVDQNNPDLAGVERAELAMIGDLLDCLKRAALSALPGEPNPSP